MRPEQCMGHMPYHSLHGYLCLYYVLTNTNVVLYVYKIGHQPASAI